MEDFLGPALPPGYTQSRTVASSTFGPALPKTVVHVSEGHSGSCRSVLLPKFQVVNYSDTDSDKSVKPLASGPALPPRFRATTTLVRDSSVRTPTDQEHTDACGPTLPPEFKVANSLEADKGTSFVKDNNTHSCGPALPPGFQVERGLEPDPFIGVKQELPGSCGPALPPGFQVAKGEAVAVDAVASVVKQEHLDTCGPALPPRFQVANSLEADPVASVVKLEHLDSCGPALPPGYQVANSLEEVDPVASVVKQEHLDSCGPALPPGFQVAKSLEADLHVVASVENQEHLDSCGPALPPGFQVANGSSLEEVDPVTSVVNQKHLDSCGPALPPGFQGAKSLVEADPVASVENQEHLNSCGPALPPGFQVASLEADPLASVENQVHLDSCGPALPPGFQVAKSLEADPVASVENQEHLDSCGPALPPGFQVANSLEELGQAASAVNQKYLDSCGPALPPGFQVVKSLEADPVASVKNQEHLDSCGPALPPGFQVAYSLEADSVASVENQEHLDSCGPALPPGFQVANSFEADPGLGTSPVVQQHPKSCGPSLPPGFHVAHSLETENPGPDISILHKEHCGPALPPWLQAVKSSVTNNLLILGAVTTALDKVLSQSWGPVLPPGFQTQNNCTRPTDNGLSNSATWKQSLGPPLPPGFLNAKPRPEKCPCTDQVVGPLKIACKSQGRPALPPEFQNTESITDADVGEAVGLLDSESCGPALPPGFQTAESLPIDFNHSCGKSIQNSSSTGISLGPALPPGFQAADELEIGSGSDQDVHVPSPVCTDHSIGPALPPGFQVVGPSESDSNSCQEVQLPAGPVLPPEFRTVHNWNSDSNSREVMTSVTTQNQRYGPSLSVFETSALKTESSSIQELLTSGPEFEIVEPSDSDSNSVQGKELLSRANQSVQPRVQTESTSGQETESLSASNRQALPVRLSLGINSELPPSPPKQAMSRSIGPTLPPGFKTTADAEDLNLQIHAEPWSDDDNDIGEQPSLGPSLPPNFANTMETSPSLKGPILPPGLAKNKGPTVEKDSEETVGPSLPPGFAHGSTQKDSSSKYVGPVLPEAAKPAIGPTLPPGPSLQEHGRQETTASVAHPIGPVLPQCLKTGKTNFKKGKGDPRIGPVGPVLPPGFLQQSSSDEDSQEDVVSPVLPSSVARVGPVGPALPPGFKMQSASEDDLHVAGSQSIGPAFPPGFRYVGDGGYEVEDDVVGPMPLAGRASKLSAAEEFERRSKKMKDKLTGKDDEANTATTRESWMTELPSDELGRSLGLVQRKFTTGIGSSRGGDRSVWTDTPADKARKEKEGDRGTKRPVEAVYSGMSARDHRMEQQIDSYNKTKRKESLMDMHSKKMKKKHEEEKDIPKERRPFSREEDLGTNKFDDAQRKSIIKKARGLDSRFSHGEQKFH